MPTCGSNFDTLPICDYLRLCAMCPPLPHRYSNIGNRWKSLLSRSKHSLFQKPLSHSHPACSPKITQCHSQKSLKITHSLTHSHRSCKPNRDRQLLHSAVAGRLTHGYRASLHLTGSWKLEVVHANRFEVDQDYCCSVQPLQVD